MTVSQQEQEPPPLEQAEALSLGAQDAKKEFDDMTDRLDDKTALLYLECPAFQKKVSQVSNMKNYEDPSHILDYQNMMDKLADQFIKEKAKELFDKIIKYFENSTAEQFQAYTEKQLSWEKQPAFKQELNELFQKEIQSLEAKR